MPMTEDEARRARTDKLIADMEATIAEAQAVSAKVDAYHRVVGLDMQLARDILRKDRCSPDLWAMVEEDLSRLYEELKVGQAALLAESGRGPGSRRHRRTRRMTRI